jgi:hypothetical protein
VRVPSLLVAFLAGAVVTAQAQFGPPATGFTVENPVLRRIWALGMDSSQAERLGQVILDSLGPRLTGTPESEGAQDWLVGLYRSWGVAARKERYGTWNAWRRGVSHLDLVAPRVRSLEAMLLGWSAGTGGQVVRGEVVVLPDIADSTAAPQALASLQGKWVLASFAPPSCRPDTAWAQYGLPETVRALRAGRQAAQNAFNQRLLRYGGQSRLAARLEAAGAAGILTTNWSGGYGVIRVFSTRTERIPAFVLGCEDYGLLWRLAEHRQGPVVEGTAVAEHLGEVPVYNVIGEIRGRELPNEYVMLSAHFDSWDGGSGATDNGTGTLTMLEAMRLLRLAYPAPRRTILVGHWNAEEQGLIGSAAFVADNPRIVENLHALFNQDNGTGRIESMSASGYTLAAGNLARYLAQIPADLTRHIRFGAPGTPGGGGTDHASFVCAGAPGFGLGSGMWDYFLYTWHTNRDTYDKVSWDDIRMNATLTAMLVYLAAEDPQRMPRDRRTVFPTSPSGQPGRWPTCGTVQRSAPAPVR